MSSGQSELSGNAPGAAAVFAALSSSLKAIPGLDPLFLKAVLEYVNTLRLPDSTPPTSTIPLEEQLRYDRLARRVKRILSDNEEPVSFNNRFKRPTGSMSARAGNLLFYPPSTNKDSSRDTLVYGPDTTSRMLRAGLSDIGLYTMDMYPFSTKIPRTSACNKAFKFDESFSHKDTAIDLWDVLTSDASEVYSLRAVKPGLEVVWGRPVWEAYTKATSTLPSSYQWLKSTARLNIPGIVNEHGSFAAGEFIFDYQIAYRKILSAFQFGKVVIRHCHPCQPGAAKAKGAAMTVDFWRAAVSTDALLQVLYVVSRGAMPDPVASAYTFADVAKPIPVTRGRSVSTRMDITLWRSKEKVSGQRWSRADLDERDPNIMIYISRWYTIDETSSKSILGQACSAIRAKQVVTMGPEGLKAAAAKAKKTLGEKGRKAVRAKAIVTLGKAGLRAIAAKRKQTLGPKGLKAAAAKAKNTLGEKGRKAVRAKQIVTMGVKGLKAARAKQVKTMGSEGCKAATAKAKKTLGKEGRKAARAKQAESMGEAGRRAAGLVHRATLTGNRPSRLGELASLTKQDIDKWLEYMENIRAGRNNKQFISLCRATINNLRREMLARDGKAPLPNDPSSFVYWPPALPYKPVSYTVDEIEHVGAWIVAGKLKVKEDSEGVEVAENA